MFLCVYVCAIRIASITIREGLVLYIFELELFFEENQRNLFIENIELKMIDTKKTATIAAVFSFISYC